MYVELDLKTGIGLLKTKVNELNFGKATPEQAEQIEKIWYGVKADIYSSTVMEVKS